MDADEEYKRGGAGGGAGSVGVESEEDKGSESGTEESSDKKSDGSKRSGFLPLLEEWTWGEVSREECNAM